MLCPRAQILDGDKYLWQALGSGLWPIMVLVSEIVQVRAGLLLLGCCCRCGWQGWQIVQVRAGSTAGLVILFHFCLGN